MRMNNVKEFVTDEVNMCLVTEKFSARNTDKLILEGMNNLNSKK
jgi:hypothetical protein